MKDKYEIQTWDSICDEAEAAMPGWWPPPRWALAAIMLLAIVLALILCTDTTSKL